MNHQLSGDTKMRFNEVTLHAEAPFIRLSNLNHRDWCKLAVIAARPCLAGLIPEAAMASLRLLCQIVEFTTQPVMRRSELPALDQLVLDHEHGLAAAWGDFAVT